MSTTAKITATLRGNFGRLWSRGHEALSSAELISSSSNGVRNGRRIISVSGPNAQTYLQGLVTCDLTADPVPPREEMNGDHEDDLEVRFTDSLRSACFLDNKGRILTDSLLWKVDEEQYFIDLPASSSSTDDSTDNGTNDSTDNSTSDGGAAAFLQHLQMFRTRRQRKIQIEDVTSKVSSHAIYGTQASIVTPPNGYLAGLDPRHPSLGLRLLNWKKDDADVMDINSLIKTSEFPDAPGTYDFIRRLAGIAEGSDELQGKIALESNQEFLNAVSFSKGCYLGQELTARVQHTGAIRKRIVPLFLTTKHMQIPQPWIVASSIQQQQQQQKQQHGSEDASASSVSNVLDMTLGKPLSPLPRLSIAAAGSMVGMMTGQIPSQGDDEDDSLLKLQELADPLLDFCATQVKIGDALVDPDDGKTIGHIISVPTEGTNVVLAQMRLDRLGLLLPSSSGRKQNAAAPAGWSHLNKVIVGDNDRIELRYLPYLPLWWPEIDPRSGKAKEQVDVDDELDSN